MPRQRTWLTPRIRFSNCGIKTIEKAKVLMNHKIVYGQSPTWKKSIYSLGLDLDHPKVYSHIYFLVSNSTIST